LQLIIGNTLRAFSNEMHGINKRFTYIFTMHSTQDVVENDA